MQEETTHTARIVPTRVSFSGDASSLLAVCGMFWLTPVVLTFTYSISRFRLQGTMSLPDLQEIVTCLPGNAYSHTSLRGICCTFLNRHQMSHCMDSPDMLCKRVRVREEKSTRRCVSDKQRPTSDDGQDHNHYGICHGNLF